MGYFINSFLISYVGFFEESGYSILIFMRPQQKVHSTLKGAQKADLGKMKVCVL